MAENSAKLMTPNQWYGKFREYQARQISKRLYLGILYTNCRQSKIGILKEVVVGVVGEGKHLSYKETNKNNTVDFSPKPC